MKRLRVFVAQLPEYVVTDEPVLFITVIRNADILGRIFLLRMLLRPVVIGKLSIQLKDPGVSRAITKVVSKPVKSGLDHVLARGQRKITGNRFGGCGHRAG